MLIQPINRNDAEKVFCTFTSAAAVAANQPVALDLVTNVDGVNIVSTVAGNLDATVGVVDTAIAAGAIGLVQVYGYRSKVNIQITTVSQAAGVKLVPVASAAYLAYSAAADGKYGWFTAMASISTSSATTTGTLAVFIRCL